MRMFAAAASLMIVALAAPVFAETVQPQTGSPPPQTVSTEAKPGSEEVVIEPGAKRATPPDGDPRSIGEKREQAAAYDRCVVNAKEPQMYDPVGSTPEEYCSRRLGMDDRKSIPNSVKSPK